MTTISKEHSDRLYWLGRYTERAFITMKTIQKLYDKMLDRKNAYADFLRYFGIADTYGSNETFMRSFLYDDSNTNSVAYSLERSYDNGIVLREEISTESLSFLQLAKDTLAKSESSKNTRLSLLPLEDQMYAFWGCVNEHIYNDEIRNIIYIGKTIERLDLYIRMEYPFDITQKEYIRLMKNLERAPKGTPYRYNTANYSELVKIMETEDEYKLHSKKVINCLEHLFEPMEVTV
ncbi:alpha-E domain-containing protein [uncultured Ruminococcus sp.]|uniref:alpha-E domain-containing protein n=1 Tax=uncultured Ruminococcus sp. TaxID=165186 RepID=UPI0026050765|nr:alpha-E domain-containing protein [uncultured Ruminococcus sp.]